MAQSFYFEASEFKKKEICSKNPKHRSNKHLSMTHVRIKHLMGFYFCRYNKQNRLYTLYIYAYMWRQQQSF